MLQLWKFIINRPTQDVDNPALEWRDCLAVCVAASKEEAQQRLQIYAAENGYDPRWLASARCYPLPLNAGVVGCWVMQ